MAEPEQRPTTAGLAAEFDRPEALAAAVRAARDAGYRQIEAYTAWPVEGIDDALPFTDDRTPLAALLGGIGGAVAGLGLQVYTNLDFPLNVGGRPLIATPGLALITFELMVLGAVTATVATMLYGCRLPRLHHPIFNLDRFSLARRDRGFLVIGEDDALFGPRKTRRFLLDQGATEVLPVPLLGARS